MKFQSGDYIIYTDYNGVETPGCITDIRKHDYKVLWEPSNPSNNGWIPKSIMNNSSLLDKRKMRMKIIDDLLN